MSYMHALPTESITQGQYCIKALLLLEGSIPLPRVLPRFLAILYHLVKLLDCRHSTFLDSYYFLLLCRCGGTVGAILTCPLEVVKTRLQSSSVTLYISEVQLNTVNGASVNRVTRVSPGPLHCLK